MRKKKQSAFFDLYFRSRFWKNWRQEALYSIPMLLGLVIMVLFPTIWGFAIGAIVGGFTGIIVIHQRKAPGTFVTIKGTPAVIIGILIVIIAWGGALLGLLAYLFHW